LSIDVDLSTSNPAAQLNYAHFQGSFLSLVTETLVEDELLFPKKEDHKDNFPIFFTEKTYRPIAAGHPFIIFGTRYHLMKLKEQGFATFASWWSEDYDNELDANKKTKMIVEEIRKLSLLSTDKLIQMRIEMEPVLRHNQALLKSLQQQSEYCGEEPVYKIIQEIWSGF
jgi:hypothetical protein